MGKGRRGLIEGITESIKGDVRERVKEGMIRGLIGGIIQMVIARVKWIVMERRNGLVFFGGIKIVLPFF